MPFMSQTTRINTIAHTIFVQSSRSLLALVSILALLSGNQVNLKVTLCIIRKNQLHQIKYTLHIVWYNLKCFNNYSHDGSFSNAATEVLGRGRSFFFFSKWIRTQGYGLINSRSFNSSHAL